MCRIRTRMCRMSSCVTKNNYLLAGFSTNSSLGCDGCMFAYIILEHRHTEITTLSLLLHHVIATSCHIDLSCDNCSAGLRAGHWDVCPGPPTFRDPNSYLKKDFFARKNSLFWACPLPVCHNLRVDYIYFMFH